MKNAALWIGAAIVGAGAIAAVALSKSSASASTPTPSPTPGPLPPQLPPSILTGHRYRVVMTGAPIAGIAPGTLTVPSLQSSFDSAAPGYVRIVSLSVAGPVLTIFLDYLGPTQLSKTVSPAIIDQLKAKGITVAISDAGLTSAQVVGGPSNAIDRDALWHAWKQDSNDQNDSGTEVYFGPIELYAATAALYYANMGFRSGYYASL